VSFPGAAVLLKRIDIARETARGRVGSIHFTTIQRRSVREALALVEVEVDCAHTGVTGRRCSPWLHGKKCISNIFLRVVWGGDY